MNIDELAVALAKSFPWIKDGTSIIVLLMAIGRLIKSLQERNGLVFRFNNIATGFDRKLFGPALNLRSIQLAHEPKMNLGSGFDFASFALR
jgi:hypothetical protein